MSTRLDLALCRKRIQPIVAQELLPQTVPAHLARLGSSTVNNLSVTAGNAPGYVDSLLCSHLMDCEALWSTSRFARLTLSSARRPR